MIMIIIKSFQKTTLYLKMIRDIYFNDQFYRYIHIAIISFYIFILSYIHQITTISISLSNV